MELKALSLSDVEQVRQWRNEQIEMLRTPFLLTQEQQVNFYHDVICNRQANARYWGIWTKNIPINSGLYPNIKTINGYLIGMCGLENISWENRLAEISLILNPEYPMDKYGEEALRLLLHEGFMNMNLENIFTEVYTCSPYIEFWNEIDEKYNPGCGSIYLPNRKYFNGIYYGSNYINIEKGAYLNENTVS